MSTALITTEYAFQKKLGFGANREVRLARHKITHQEAAIKKIKTNARDNELNEMIFNEITILAKCVRVSIILIEYRITQTL